MSDQDYSALVDSAVYSSDGANVGTVTGIVSGDGEAPFLHVDHNGLFGIGTESYLVPVGAITDSGDGKVTIDKSAEELIGVPAHDSHEPHGQGYFSDAAAWWWREPEI